MDCSTPGLSVPHHLPEFAQVHVHCIGDAVQPSHPLTSSSPAVNNSQHQGLFQSVVCLHQFSSVAQSCPTLYNPMDGSTPGLPVHHQLLEIAQTHDHQVGDAIHPLLCLNYQKFGCGCPSRRGEAVLYITLAKAGHWAKKPQQNINVSLFVVPDSCPTLEIPEE